MPSTLIVSNNRLHERAMQSELKPVNATDIAVVMTVVGISGSKTKLT